MYFMDCSNFFFEFVTLLRPRLISMYHAPYLESFQCVPHKTMENHSMVSELPMLTSSFAAVGTLTPILCLLHQNVFQSPKPDHKHLFLPFPLEKPNN